MAEAEETGGAIQRHLGTTTSRFGLSQNTDNRLDPTNSTIPMPPIRASATVKSTRPKIKTFTINTKAQTMGGVVRSQNRLSSTGFSGGGSGGGANDDMSYVSEEENSDRGGGGGGQGRPAFGLLNADSSDDEQ
eukprot:gene24363-30692_t